MASIIGVKNVWGSWGITKSSEFLGEVVVMRFFPRPSPSRSNPLLRSFHPSRCHVCTPSRMAPGPAATLDYSMLLLFTLGSSNLETSLWGDPFHQPTNQTVHSEYFRLKSPFCNSLHNRRHFCMYCIFYRRVKTWTNIQRRAVRV